LREAATIDFLHSFQKNEELTAACSRWMHMKSTYAKGLMTSIKIKTFKAIAIMRSETDRFALTEVKRA
jgi:hypothetical protein